MNWVQQLIRRLRHVSTAGRRPRGARKPVGFYRLGVEGLEDRTVPSWALPASEVATPAGFTTPVGYTPPQMRQAYGIDQVQFSSGVAGDGSGQTIAIVSAFHNPNISADLTTFSTAFGLPAIGSGFTFTVVGQTGGAPPTGTSSIWAQETALDVQWAHAVAPKANILLVEATSNSRANLLAAVDYARGVAGVSVVSMSWRFPEESGQSADNSYFTTPSGHTPVTFLAAAGNFGTPASYPSTSPNVVSVGGTSIELVGLTGGASVSLWSEEAWSLVGEGSTGLESAGGGGISRYESQPTYQAGRTPSSTHRTTPDVAFPATNATGSGFAVVDSFNKGSAAPWVGVSGTSYSAPVWAGLVAIANQGRALNSLPTLDGPSGTLPALYGMSESNYRDVVFGNTGRAAGPGYDLATGLGSPKARQVVAALSGNAPASSTVGGDSFGTQYASGLGPDWTVAKGSFNVPSALRATVTGTPTSDIALAVYEPTVLADVSVSAAVTVPASSGGSWYNSVDLVARYADLGTYYHARLYASAGGTGLEIYRHVGGVATPVASHLLSPTAPTSTTSGTLTFEVVGNQLRLSLGGTVYLSAVDDQIRLPGQTGAGGSTGGSTGATADAFAVAPLLAPTDAPFTDTFFRAASATPGPAWDVVVGQVEVVNTVVNSVPVEYGFIGGSGPGAAVYQQGLAADVGVEAVVAIPASAGAGIGVLARYTGPGDTNYYQSYVSYQSGRYYVGILKNVGGTYTAGLGGGLFDLGPATGSLQGVLRLEAVGNVLRVFWNGDAKVTAVDTQLTGPGYAGVRGAPNALFDNFSVSTTVQSTMLSSAADAFTGPAAGSLGGPWAVTIGQVGVSGNAAVVPSGVVGAAAAVFATGVAADMSVSANVSASNGGAGVLVRQTGPGDGNFYQAFLSHGGSSAGLGLIKKVGSTYTPLWSDSLVGPFGPSAGGTLRLEVVGSFLRVYWNGSLVAAVQDTELTGPGYAGVRGSAGAVFDDFAVTTPAGLPFTDSFTGSGLGASWTGTFGSPGASGGVAVVGGGGAAVYNQGTAADVAVSATVSLNPTSGIGGGLLARYTGPGDNNFYQAYATYESGRYYVRILKNVGGAYTVLGSYDFGASSSPLSGTLRFEVGGSLLRAFWNGQVLVSAVDTALPGRGSVGFRGAGVTFDDFAASALTAAPFVDTFNRSFSPGDLWASWTNTLGWVGVSGNNTAVVGSGGAGAAIYNQGAAADVSVSAAISLNAMSGAGGGVMARYTGSGDNNFYQGYVVYDGANYNLAILKNMGGAYTVLKTVALGTSSGTLSGTLRFEVVGSVLRLFWTGTFGSRTIYVHDTDLSGPGYTGLRGAAGTTFDDFSFTQV